MQPPEVRGRHPHLIRCEPPEGGSLHTAELLGSVCGPKNQPIALTWSLGAEALAASGLSSSGA